MIIGELSRTHLLKDITQLIGTTTVIKPSSPKFRIELLNTEPLQWSTQNVLVHCGGILKVFLGEWNGLPVAVVKLKTPLYRDDFIHGVDMLTVYHTSRLVTQLVGRCDETNTFVTEFHRHGSANRLIPLIHNSTR